MEQSQVLSNLEKEKEKALKELADCEELDSMLRYQVAEMQRTEADLTRQLELMRKENNDLVQPQLKKINDDIVALKEESIKQTTMFESEKKKKADYIAKIESLKESKVGLEELKKQTQVQLAKFSSDPARIQKQIEVIHLYHASVCPVQI